jgi:hypothetical protein
VNEAPQIIRSTGGDGAYVGLTPHTHFRHDRGTLSVTVQIESGVRTFDGAEQQPIAVMPAPNTRSTWPTTLAACVLVFAIDHGNVGCAILVALYWASWRVSR